MNHHDMKEFRNGQESFLSLLDEILDTKTYQQHLGKHPIHFLPNTLFAV